MTIDKEKLLKTYQAIQNDKNRKDEIKQELYKVGYKKPPVNSQFKKGVSGNPAGRKKKAPPRTILEELQVAFIKEVSVTNENGKKEKISLIQAFAKKIVQDAIKNDGPTRKMLLQNLQFLKFDFLSMLENIALKDFEPETSVEDEQYYINSLNKLIDLYYST